MTSNPAYTYRPESDWADTSVGTYRMSNDQPNLSTGNSETNIPENPTAQEIPSWSENPTNQENQHWSESPTNQENRRSTKKRLRVILICIALGITVTAAAIVTAVSVTKPVNLGDDMVWERLWRLVLLEDWSPALNDSTSAAYKEAVSRIEREIESSLKNDNLPLVYESVEVINLRPGSIIVYFRVTIILPSDTSSGKSGGLMVTVKGSDARQELTAVLKNSIKNTAKLRIDRESVSILEYFRPDSVTDSPSALPGTSHSPSATTTKTPSVTDHSTTDPRSPSSETTTLETIRPETSPTVRSPNCTFEDDDCGYRVVRPVHKGGSQWMRSGTGKGNASDTGPLNIDHTTNAEGGYVMVVQASTASWSNLASPEFPPFPGESCLEFYWHSSSLDRTNVLQVHARIGGRTKPVVQLHPDDYNEPTASVDNVTLYSPVFVTIPAHADRVFFQMKAGKVNFYTQEEHSFEKFAKPLVFAIDDIFLSQGPCHQASVNCSFDEPGMCGYSDPYVESNWKTVNTTSPGRHLAFSDVTLGRGYIASPVIPQTPSPGCLSFDYEFTGVHGGSLTVYVAIGEIAEKKLDFRGERLWSLTSSGHQSWRSVRVPINQSGTSGYRVVFEGKAGVEESDVISVDNIRLDLQTCSEIVCGPGEFKCASTLTCIPKEEKCNSVNDCSDIDLSDETDTDCGSTTKCQFSDSFFCGYRNATGSEGLWVRWEAKEPTPMRLVGPQWSSQRASGRVEIYHKGMWGNICDTGITISTASVICRNLGYESFVEFHCCLQYGSGTGRFWIHNLRCSGSESDISDCSHYPWGVGTCAAASVLALTCEGDREEPDTSYTKGITSVFSLQSDFADIAHMVSPPLDCLQRSGGCEQTCVKVDMDGLPPLHTPLAILGENNSGKKRRLWTSWGTSTGNSEAISVTLPATDLRRLHFLSYFTLGGKTSIKIIRIEEQNKCVPSKGCSDLDPSRMCDGVADCPDGSDEWGAPCSGNVSISCTFDDHHSCGYAGVSRLSPWRRGNISQIREDFTLLESFRFLLPLSDHKQNTSGVMLYFVPRICRETLAVNELLLPQSPELAEGGCLRIIHSSSGNFTLTSPEGHVYHVKGRGPSTISWITTRVEIPRGTGPLSIIVDCLAGHMIIDEIIFYSKECPSAWTTTTYCPPGDVFLCENGREIPCDATCSGHNYCWDYSGEKDCPCRSNQVSCGGLCRDADLFCDGKVDCLDGSDEQLDCACPAHSSYTCTKNGHVSCRSASRYCSPDDACDEEKDCCSGAQEECCGHMGSFRCGTGECISILYRCNYASDCADSSDEVNCTCRAHDFVCPNSGVCINPVHVCNGFQNCPDGEDEGLDCLDCDQDTEYKCKESGLCVKKSKVCDGTRDCGDGSDEDECSDCSGNRFRCEKSGVCIYKYQKCNGGFDCLTGTVDDVSDESSCVCGTDETRCDNGACIYREYWCNGVNNCHDNSDETNCDVCPPHYWKCRSGRCVHLEFRCDGYQDCEDGSDESNCLQCQAGQVASCNNQKCLNKADICDGRINCDDETDEMYCGVLLTGNDTQGLVYFNKSGSRYPLCADNVLSNTQALDNLCQYLFSGSYVHAESILASSLTQDFLVYNRLPIMNVPLTSLLDVRECASRSMVRLSCQKSACGTPLPLPPGAPYIIGGEKSKAGEWPWVAEIRYLGKHQCGAAVINENYVLTAAHCVEDTSLPFRSYVASYYTVVVGSTRPTSPNSQSLIRRIGQVIVHEGYFVHPEMRKPSANDIALVKLLQPLDMTDPDVRPICLADKGSALPSKTVCHVAGWGMSIPVEQDSLTLDLYHARVPLVNDSDCRQTWNDFLSLNHSLICAGFRTDSTGSCHGDSGGPLMCLSPAGLWRVEGVVSFGAHMCVADPSTGLVRPSVFTPVAEYREWIDQKIRENR